MADKREQEILSKFADVAALAGIRGEVDTDEGLFVTGFRFSDDRSQMVYVRALPEAAKGQDAVCVYSPCRRVKKGFMKGLNKEQSLELLKLNSELMFARYGVIDNDDELLVMASVDCLIDTLDPEECEAVFSCVALAADRYEEKFGGDEF